VTTLEYDGVGCYAPPASTPGAFIAGAMTPPLMAGSDEWRSTVARRWQWWCGSSSSIYVRVSMTTVAARVLLDLWRRRSSSTVVRVLPLYGSNADFPPRSTMVRVLLLNLRRRRSSSSMVVVRVPLLYDGDEQGLDLGLDLGSAFFIFEN
jgi:hypothetical protein